MAQHVPIIAPNIEEYTDILTNQINSLIYKYDSIEDCLKKVEILLEDSDLRKKLGADGIKIAREKFYWQNIADNVEDIYRSL